MSNPKTRRPVSTKRSMHIVLKTELLAFRQTKSFLGKERNILEKLKQLRRRCGFRLYRVVIMQNHIHLILRVYRRESLIRFLREMGGFLGKLFPGRSPLFSGRPFSRILEWGKDYRGVHCYLEKNEQEKTGDFKTMLVLRRTRDSCEWGNLS